MGAKRRRKVKGGKASAKAAAVVLEGGQKLLCMLRVCLASDWENM